MALKESTLKTEDTTTKTEESTLKVEKSTSEVQKFSKEELETLTNLQSKSQNIVFQFGQLYMSKLRLEEQEDNLLAYSRDLEEQESKLAKSLSDKYGKGSINIETGEFTPSEA